MHLRVIFLLWNRVLILWVPVTSVWVWFWSSALYGAGSYCAGGYEAVCDDPAEQCVTCVWILLSGV